MTNASCPVCGDHFTTTRKGHIYCSDGCRNKAHRKTLAKKKTKSRNERLAVKLKKLSSSSFGIWLVGELRRAGTVEVLRGHTKETLDDLVRLRKVCNKFSGYEEGRPLRHYEIAHIYPVNGTLGVGRLHPVNLVIAAADFNRSHGVSEPLDAGQQLYCAYETLDDRWVLASDLTTQEVLKKAKSYLGKVFDKWLIPLVVNERQRDTLIKQLNNSTERRFARNLLKQLDLANLKILATYSGISVYNIDIHPSDALEVIATELERHCHTGALKSVVDRVVESNCTLSGLGLPKEMSERDDNPSLEEFLTEQAQLCLHHFPYSETWKGRKLSDWLKLLDQFLAERGAKPRDIGIDEDDLL
jgi:hypothetical protein